MSRVLERYFAMEYLTPGARETADAVRAHCGLTARNNVLELASGKGTTAVALAEEYGCRVVGIDPYSPFVTESYDLAVERGVSSRATFLLADGGRAPVRDGAFDAAICIGAPSIVGTKRCFRTMARALKPGGVAVASDWTWVTESPPPEAVPAGVKAPFVTLDTYSAIIRECGFEIVVAEAMPQRVWDEYYAPLRVITSEERAANPGMPEDPIESEIAAYDAGGKYWQYSLFVARKT